MSHVIVKSADLRNLEEIYLTCTDSNVVPKAYLRIRYTGTLRDLFVDLHGRNLQIMRGNKQKVHDAYLQSRLYLQSEGYDLAEFWDLMKEESGTSELVEKSFAIFEDVIESKKNQEKYYISIEGKNFYSWSPRGFKYSDQKVLKSFTDLLLAQVEYGDRVSYTREDEVFKY